MPRRDCDPDNRRVASGLSVLQGRCELEAMRRDDPVIVVTRCDQRCGLRGALTDFVVGRAGPEHRKIVGIFGCSVIRDPRPTDRELMESKQIHYSNGRDGCGKQVWTLSHARAHEHSTITPR